MTRRDYFNGHRVIGGMSCDRASAPQRWHTWHTLSPYIDRAGAVFAGAVLVWAVIALLT
jgi:hypothetical protein